MFTNLNHNPLEDSFTSCVEDLQNGIYKEQRLTLRAPSCSHDIIFRFFYSKSIEDFSIVDVIKSSAGNDILFADFIKQPSGEWKNSNGDLRARFIDFFPNLERYILVADEVGDVIEVTGAAHA
jgi:hypothetical protein